MNFGLYSSFLGMRARQRALDVMAHNIANASTTGFKAGQLTYQSIEAPRTSSDSAQPSQTAVSNAPQPFGRALGVATGGSTDFSAGSMRETGRSLDLALEGDGFLAVRTPRGERYTRAGNLTMDASGQLVTQGGDLVVGEGGSITLPPGEVTIGADGTISVKGQTVDRLKVVRFNDPRAELVKEGESLFTAQATARPLEAEQTRIVQGALETSNVNSMTEMVAMMQNGREFESLQRSVTLMMNDLGRKVASEIGRI